MVQETETLFRSRGIEDAAVDAWYLLEYVTGMSRTDYLLRRQEMMKDGEQERYRELAAKRAAHIPLQHLTGTQEFMGFSFCVNEHVLVPRQDTETLVEEAVSYLRLIRQKEEPVRVLDLCTGSGCIAVSLKKLCPRIHMTASDLSADALTVARENGSRLEAEITWVESDLFERLTGRFDLIVSNPPYIRTDVIETLSEEVRCHEPYQALDGHEDGLFYYRRIIQQAHEYLHAGGSLMFEIGYDQGSEVADLMRQNGFTGVEVKKDLAGADRVVLGTKKAINN
jgi:release factor glutamine methyltransferase